MKRALWSHQMDQLTFWCTKCCCCFEVTLNILEPVVHWPRNLWRQSQAWNLSPTESLSQQLAIGAQLVGKHFSTKIQSGCQRFWIRMPKLDDLTWCHALISAPVALIAGQLTCSQANLAVAGCGGTHLAKRNKEAALIARNWKHRNRKANLLWLRCHRKELKLIAGRFKWFRIWSQLWLTFAA